MAGQQVYYLIFLMPSPRLELRTLVHYNTFLENLSINPSNTKLNPICHLLALLGAHHILHVSRIRFKRQVKSHLPSTGIIRSSPFSPR